MPQDPTLARWARQREPSATEIFSAVQRGHQINLLRRGQEFAEKKFDVATRQTVEAREFEKEQMGYQRETALMAARLRQGYDPETGEPLPLTEETKAEHEQTMARIKSQMLTTERSLALVEKQMQSLQNQAVTDLQKAQTDYEKSRIKLFSDSIKAIQGLMTSPFAAAKPEETKKVVDELNKMTESIAKELGYEYTPTKEAVEKAQEQQKKTWRQRLGEWIAGDEEKPLAPAQPLAQALQKHQQSPEAKIQIDALVNFEKNNPFNPNLLPPSKRGASQKAKAVWETEISKQGKKWYKEFQSTGDLPSNRDVQNFLILLRNKVQTK